MKRVKSGKNFLGIPSEEKLIYNKKTGINSQGSVQVISEYVKEEKYEKAKSAIKEKIKQRSKKTLLHRLGLKEWKNPLIEFDYALLARITAMQGNVDEAVGYLQEAADVVKESATSSWSKSNAFYHLNKVAAEEKLPFNIHEEYFNILNKEELSDSVKLKDSAEIPKVVVNPDFSKNKPENEKPEDIENLLESGYKLRSQIVDIDGAYITESRAKAQEESKEGLNKKTDLEKV